MSLFLFDESLKIGTVFEVNGNKIKIALSKARDELTRLHRGRIYKVGSVGSLVRIRFGRRILFSIVRSLRLQTEEEAAVVEGSIDSESRVLEADLIGEGFWNTENQTLDFQRGVSASALPLQDVHIVTDKELELVYDTIERDRGDNETLVPIGAISVSSQIRAMANIDKMFGHHCAVLGSTGSGKSSFVAALIRSTLEFRIGEDQSMQPQIVLIDPHGEYGHAFRDSAVEYRAYDALAQGAEEAVELRLPYWLMSSDEFRSLIIGKTEFEATSQANVVYKALAHARMVEAGLIHPAEDWIGRPVDDVDGHPEDPRPVDAEADIAGFDRDKPMPFSLVEFRAHIEKEQCLRIQGGSWKRVTDSDWDKNFVSVLNKLKVLENDPRLDFMTRFAADENLSVATIISQFIGPRDDGRNLRIINISGLPNEVASPLTAAIARTLFQYKLYQNDTERRNDPILLVCEEAHRYVPNRGEAQYSAAQNAVRRIAKEGRKYGIGLMLVSQRPSEIEGTVLSQCGTWLVLRLSNSSDQSHVRQFLPDTISSMVNLLPSLPRREALFVGEGAALPTRITIRELSKDQLPQSNDVRFGDGWGSDPTPMEQIRQICDRMTN